MRLISIATFVLIFVLATGLYLISYGYFKTQEIEKATARMSLYRSTLEAELRHFAHLPFLLSLDPIVMQTLQGTDVEPLDRRLARFSQSAGLEAIYLMNNEGLTISASNAKGSNSFKNQNYAYRPYFQDALNGQLGEFYGIGATTGIPGYFYAMAVRATQPDAQGVIAIKIDLSRLQEIWQASGENIILANADGVVLLASDSDWRYKTLAKLTPDQRERIVASRQFGREPLDALEWSFDLSRKNARLAGSKMLYVNTADLPNSWTLHFFVEENSAATRALLVAGTFLALVLLGFTALQVNRLGNVRTALRASEKEETELRKANQRLAVEIEDRRAAQLALQKTQTELERAGRLAALGQLASSVTHELGQPIAAMRNQLVASDLTDGPTPLNEKMQGLVARMEDITRQLKFFSRKGRDSFEVFDLNDAIEGALSLLEPNIEVRKPKIEFVRSETELSLYANRLRIEQVVTNIVRNALDAIEASDRKIITISSGATPQTVWFKVEDTGPGLGDKTLDDLREPFATTRASGEGMGLGLTICAGIVSDHNGTISARDRQKGGAEFHIELPTQTKGAL